MLSFSKGFNNQNNVDSNKYAKMGRVTPEEIIQKRFNNNIKNINEQKKEQNEFKTVEQKNMGNSFNRMNAFRNINK